MSYLINRKEIVVSEKNEIDFKINDLNEYMKTDIYVVLPENQKDLLVQQYTAMSNYSNILTNRIRLLSYGK